MTLTPPSQPLPAVLIMTKLISSLKAEQLIDLDGIPENTRVPPLTSRFTCSAGLQSSVAADDLARGVGVGTACPSGVKAQSSATADKRVGKSPHKENLTGVKTEWVFVALMVT